MATHVQEHALNSTDNHAPGTAGTLLGTSAGGAVTEITVDATAASANTIVQRNGVGDVIVPLVPTTLAAAASKSYVLDQALNGTVWKELLLHGDQLLAGGAGAILQAILANVSVNPADLDNFIISDGATTETFIFKDTPTVAFDVQRGGSAAVSQANLAAAINADSTLWSAVEGSGLDDFFAGAPAAQLVIHRTAGSVADDRVYITVGTASNIQVVEFGTGQQDYQDTSGTESDIPGADPTAKRFGFGRLFADLTQNETHLVADDNSRYSWDSDDDAWQQTDGAGGVVEGDGIDVTASKVSVDAAVAVAEQQYGAVVKDRNADGSGAAAADAGNLAVKTDNVNLAVSASNELILKAGSPLGRFQGFGAWASTGAAVKSPILSEFNTALGTAAGDIGNWAFLVEDGTAVGSVSTFLAYKKANAGALADYHAVELS